MLISTKIALSAALIVAATSAAMANRVDHTPTRMNAWKWSEQLVPQQRGWNGAMASTAVTTICPWLEGYPDCR
jgi:hypothetical protein